MLCFCKSFCKKSLQKQEKRCDLKEFYHFFCALCEIVKPIFCYSTHIFNTATVFPLDINAGLYGDNVSYNKRAVLRIRRKIGAFVYVKSDTVTETVPEEAFVAHGIDIVAREAINGRTLHSAFNLRERDFLGL